ncbi:MAG: hypothetical protein DLM61_25065 [Pseudonocardiales bacterium]|nr:MAG: hypothetical protein DLM61_25065 [Pseudonocardiales bacterium]
MHRYWTVLTAGIVTLVVTVLLAGCSSSGSVSTHKADSSGVTRARALIAAASGQVTWTAPGPAFDARPAAGKSVVWVSDNQSIPFSTDTYAGFKAGLNADGVKTSIFDSQSSLGTADRGIRQAADAGAAAIMLQDIPSGGVSSAVNYATSKHVPVFGFTTQESGVAALAPLSGQTSFCYSCAGRLMAAQAVVQSNGSFKGVIFEATTVGAINTAEVQGITSGVKEFCPQECSVSVKDVPVATWASQMTTATTTAVADPSIGYLFPIYDGALPYVLTGLRSSHTDNRVRVVSYNASQGIIDNIAKKTPLTADPGNPSAWAGWAAADQVLRVLTGHPAAQDAHIPLRNFDASNVGTLDPGKPDSWYPGVDYQTKYRSLWSLK